MRRHRRRRFSSLRKNTQQSPPLRRTRGPVAIRPPQIKCFVAFLPAVLLLLMLLLPARASDDVDDESGRGRTSGHETAAADGTFREIAPFSNGTPREMPRSASVPEKRRSRRANGSSSSIGSSLAVVRRNENGGLGMRITTATTARRWRQRKTGRGYGPRAKCRDSHRGGHRRRTASLPGGTKVVVSRPRRPNNRRGKNGRAEAIRGKESSGEKCCMRGESEGSKKGKRGKGRRRGGKGRRERGKERGGRRGGEGFFVAMSSRRKMLLKGTPRYTNARLYGRWSRWSPCSRSCTTQRFRWCKKPLHCGSDVVREEAYCYVEGSFCHRWIHRRIHQQPDKDDNEADVDPLSDESDRQLAYGNNPAQSSIDLWSQKDCGVPLTNRTTSFLSFRRHQQALRIIGGRESLPGQWPWQVAVLNRFKEAFCGGTLVASRWVLTAAHCIRKRLYVRLGEHDLAEEDGTEAEFRVEEAVTHPEYDADTVDNDVALLRLPSWASSTRTTNGDLGEPRPLACLPRPRQALPLRRLCTIIGWGKRKSSDAFGTDILHEAEVPIVSNEVCRDVYEDYYITGNMFCAGYRKGRMDSCAGDSGGPLLCLSGREGTNQKWTIFGITSFGEGCGKRGKYGIYTKVSNYVRWVQRVVKGYSTSGKY